MPQSGPTHAGPGPKGRLPGAAFCQSRLVRKPENADSSQHSLWHHEFLGAQLRTIVRSFHSRPGMTVWSIRLRSKSLNRQFRQNPNFSSPIRPESTVQSLAKKYSAYVDGQIIARESRHPAPATRGVSRSSRTQARDAMDVFASTDERCRKRTAKPRGLSASTLARTWLDAAHHAGDGDKKARSPERARNKP